MMKPSDFKVGEIYKMNVGKRSYVNKPYYVQIVDVGIDYITTYIPNGHHLKIIPYYILKQMKNNNWILVKFDDLRRILFGDKQLIKKELPKFDFKNPKQK